VKGRKVFSVIQTGIREVRKTWARPSRYTVTAIATVFHATIPDQIWDPARAQHSATTGCCVFGFAQLRKNHRDKTAT